jgi:hypothetical protein
MCLIILLEGPNIFDGDMIPRELENILVSQFELCRNAVFLYSIFNLCVSSWTTIAIIVLE